MNTLKGNQINLRAIEPEDLSFLFNIENNEQFWEVSHTQIPFSRFLLKKYIENSHLDIYEAKQLRLIIELSNSKYPIGMIDLFDFNPQHKRAGIGILIHPNYQKKGYATEALDNLINYCFKHLNLRQLYANITVDNQNSLHLFLAKRFTKVGIKKDWIYNQGKFKDEILLQLINE